MIRLIITQGVLLYYQGHDLARIGKYFIKSLFGLAGLTE